MAIPVTGQAQGLVLSTSQKSGSPAALSTGWHNELLATELLPRYASLVLAGVVFSGGNTAFAALTAVGTATTGLTLFNPLGSGRNAVLLDIEIAFTPVTLATVAVTALLAGGAQATTPTGTAALTPANTLVSNGSTPVCKLYSAATIIAPTILRVLSNWQSTVLTTSGGATATASLTKDEIAGAVIVPPGAVVTVAGVGTVADATVAASITWAELPV